MGCPERSYMSWWHKIKKVPILIILFIGLALIFIQFTRGIALFAPAKKGMGLIFSLENLVYREAVYVRNWLTFFANRASLEKRYQEMEQQYRSGLIMQSQCKGAQEENILLKKALQFVDQSAFAALPASVIGVDTRRFYNTLMIDRGQGDGIAIGNAVVVDEGILIGKIISLSEHTSTALLLHDNQSKVAGTLQTQEKTIGIVEGNFGLTLVFDLIPKDVFVPKDSIVITSGLETGIPRGLLIGTVQDVQAQPHDLFQKATIAPVVDYYQYPFVLVLINSHEF